MTDPQSPQGLPIAAAAAHELTESAGPAASGPTVGAADAEADAARSGADADLLDATPDSGGATGPDDADADRRASGA